jgi:hypothetical protein
MFELKFETEHRHWKEYNLVTQQRSMGWRMLSCYAMIAVVSLTIIGVMDRQEQFDLDHRSMLFGLLATFFSTLFINSVYSDQLLKRYLKNPGIILGKHQIQLNHEGMSFYGDHVQTTYSWNLVEGVSSHKSILVVWLEPAVGVIVPKTAFQTAADELSFKALIEAKIVKPSVGQKAI